MAETASPPIIHAPATVVPPPQPLVDRHDTPIAPTTTIEEDKTTLGQRRINLIWETTQAIIAIMVTGATLYVAASLALSGQNDPAAFLLLSNVFFVVISTYIQRTNHQKIGGVKVGDTGR